MVCYAAAALAVTGVTIFFGARTIVWSAMMRMLPCLPVALALATACNPALDLRDDPAAFIADARYRRGILERDLTDRDNLYARERLEKYGVDGGWDAIDESDPPTFPIGPEDAANLAAGGQLQAREPTTLAPARMPCSDAEWIALGRRAFFEYPLAPSRAAAALLRVDHGPEKVGFLVDSDHYVGLRGLVDADGRVRVSSTCAQCHASRSNGVVDAVLANRAMDVGQARLLALTVDPTAPSAANDATSPADLARLGPGRSDVMADGIFDPFAVSDLGGLADWPYLHHNANWFNRGTATLAVRCETLFISASEQKTRIPRVLAWAVARYLRSLPPPPPADPPSPASAHGQAIFAAGPCPSCHTPPLFSSARLIGVAEIGTDPAAGASPVRHTGYYRVPSLRGVGRQAPYFHHGAVPSLEALFDPARTEPGHPFGLSLSADDRAALIAYLRTL